MRIYRWSAVAVGFVGVIVMLWPHLDLARYTNAAGIGRRARRDVRAGQRVHQCGLGDADAPADRHRDHVVDRVLFLAVLRLGGLLTLPFGWIVPSWPQLAALVALGVLGGLSHILLTESYRYAPASLVAPLDYTALLWAFMIGYWFFGEVPTARSISASAIVAGVGLFVIWRERQLGLERARARAAAGPPTGRNVAWSFRRAAESSLPKSLERDDRPGVLDAGNHLHLFVHEMADVGRVLDIELAPAGRSRPRWNRLRMRFRRRRSRSPPDRTCRDGI